jgi:hypothetical protein
MPKNLSAFRESSVFDTTIDYFSQAIRAMVTLILFIFLMYVLAMRENINSVQFCHECSFLRADSVSSPSSMGITGL